MAYFTMLILEIKNSSFCEEFSEIKLVKAKDEFRYSSSGYTSGACSAK